jgi:Domain of unknown function (DUF4334)/GXWXG protein
VTRRTDHWFTEHADGADRDEVLAWFDALPAVRTDDMLGRWRGSGLPTGSRFDGLLEASGWYGKEFVDAETAHPLLFADRAGRPRPGNPSLVPIALVRDFPWTARPAVVRRLFPLVRPLLTTRRPRARLRALEHRGVTTAAMVYDTLPVIDVFRRVDDDVRLGLMDLRGLPEPFFFVLRRDGVSDPGAPAAR